MFSLVEYASSRFRSEAIAACRIPYTALIPPIAISPSHHHAGPPPSRSRPVRTMP